MWVLRMPVTAPVVVPLPLTPGLCVNVSGAVTVGAYVCVCVA